MSVCCGKNITPHLCRQKICDD